MLRLFRTKRVTWRRLLFFGSAFLVFWTFVFSLTPIISPLPPYTGAHEVGILDLETEVERRVSHSAVLRETGDRAFELSTLAVTLYYPATLPFPVRPSPSTPRPLARPWLPQPLSLIGTGYARILHIYWPPFQALVTFALWACGRNTVIPGHVDAPFLSLHEKILVDESSDDSVSEKTIKTTESEEDSQVLELRDDKLGSGKLPMVVFTHGMAGMSQSYSHYLGSIASHGVVVAAIEHRDGSGPGSIIHYPNGTERKVWHVQTQDLVNDPPMTASDLKVAQLGFREAEIQETIRLFRRLNAGEGEEIENLKPNSLSSALPGFKNRLDMSAITVVGHSYGATGALQALKGAPSDDMPINGGIALDPGKASGTLNDDIDVPVLVMQSGEWTEKQLDFYGLGQHFEVVKKLVQKVKEGWFMTLSGTAHPSCTDAPLIVPWIMKLVTGTTENPRYALREYIDVSVEFLDFLRTGVKTGILKSEVTSPNGPLGDADKRATVKGATGADWEVHVVPEK